MIFNKSIIERKGYKVNDLYFTVLNIKDLQGRKLSRQVYILLKIYEKMAKYPHFGNKKAIIPIFFVSILWFLYGRSDGIFACATIPDKQWVSTVYPIGKLQAIFSLIQTPSHKKKGQSKDCHFSWSE